jgi:gamma-glutamyltranspeptidase/glutathione hydrolase
MVSMIQSNYEGFGSGIVVPGCGVSLHNRGAGFSLAPRHPNRVDGGKLPFHTIIPGFLSRGGHPFGAFGVMGGHMQPQGHVQLICRLENWRQGLQEAIDAPRWFVTEEFTVALEDGIDDRVRGELASRGHRIEKPQSWRVFGGAQALVVSGDGYRGASDPRKDGCAGGF